jgi:pimeloyl-ACP methyl ester carboxylesterase
MILRTRHGPLYYEIAGEGPSLVFASGWAMSSECWRPAVELLKRKYRCLIYDSRGIGRSLPTSPDAGFEIEDHADDLNSILESVGIFDATLVGHEMGALVVAVCGERHPQSMNSLVLISPRPAISEGDIKQLAVFTPAALALRELAGFPLIRNVVAWRFRRAPQPYRDNLFKEFSDLNPRLAYETAVSAASAENVTRLDRAVSRSTSRVLLICGEKDKKGATQARRLFSVARAGKLATMSDCGFLPMLEYPGQFARVLDRFVINSLKAGGAMTRTR